MNIVVLGAGTVGTSIAENLCEKGHSVIVVDNDPEKTRAINEELDVRAITGSASRSTVLFQAGISVADICLAVTGSDEINIVAASMSKAMGAHRAIARVYAPVFRDLSTFDYQEHFGLDRLLSLEQLTALELANNLRDFSSAVVEQFAHGALEVHQIIINEKSAAAGKRILDLGLSSSVRIGTISRNGRMRIARADDVLEVNDCLLIFSRPDDVSKIKSQFKQAQETKRKVVIAGGGETGFHLARILQRHRFQIRLMESDAARCEYLAKNLPQIEVINCNASHWEVLREEGVGNTDTFVACLGSDENNIMAGVEARDLGAPEIMAVVNRTDYANVVSKLGIDVAVSAREVMSRQILSFLQEGNVIRRQTLVGGDIQLVELEVSATSPATKSPLAELEKTSFPYLIMALIRKELVKVPSATDQLNPGDHIILLVEPHDAENAIAYFAT